MIRFSDLNPTIAQVYQYTYQNSQTVSRFHNEERDILKTKVKIEKRLVYRKNKEGKFSTPEEKLVILSESSPQYYPYNKVKGKKSKKQMKIRHEYDIIMCIQPYGDDKIYSYWNSKIIWHVGSFKKYPNKIPQNKVATIHSDTRARFEKKYSKLPTEQRKKSIKKELDKIRKNAKYISDSDYVSRELGINGDFYFRVNPLLLRFGASYGKVWYTEIPKGIMYPFFDKHCLNIIDFLLKKGILKYR